MQALIFDCDGVLVDTERDGHRVAFNEAFKEFGFDVTWDEAQYGELLQVAGGKERMHHYFEIAGWPPADDRDALIAELHRRKTAIFGEIISSGRLPLRPGVIRVVDEARGAGIRLGVCTTSNVKSVMGVLDLMGEERKAAFELVLAGDVVAHKKPDPEIYDLAKERLGLAARDCVVIEDSRNGLLAAQGAGIPCLITTSTYTRNEDFGGSLAVVAELGEPPAPAITIEELETLAAAQTSSGG
jgi:HAD superfamily hydrolase (TIGR01509 family)